MSPSSFTVKIFTGINVSYLLHRFRQTLPDCLLIWWFVLSVFVSRSSVNGSYGRDAMWRDTY